MAVCQDLPQLTLNVKNDEKDVLRLIEIIKPTWKKNDVKIKVLSGGHSCAMLRCSDVSGESVTVRVRSLLDGLSDPAHECLAVKAMSAKGHFPPVLAVFQNGFCYEYIPGCPLVTKTAKYFSLDDNQTRLIAEQMANIHSLVIPELDYNKSTFVEFFLNILSTSKPWFEGCPSIEELKEELKIVEEFLSKSVRSPLVFSHCDPHSANLVWNEQDNKMTYVDWELCKIAPRGCDIAYFLLSTEIFGALSEMEISKPENFEEIFCERYLQRYNEIHNKSLPTKKEIEQLLLEMKHYKLLVKLSWVIFYVKLQELENAFGPPKRTWMVYFDGYLRCKEELLAIKRLGRPTE